MEISLWMLANQLEDIISEINIQEQDQSYRGIRRRTDSGRYLCLGVRADGIKIQAVNGDYLLVPDGDEDVVFDRVQGAFEIYFSWFFEISRAVHRCDYRKIVDVSWVIFKSPMVLFDNEEHVLAMSNQVSANALDKEWNHLSKYGYTSTSAYRVMRSSFTSGITYYKNTHFFRNESEEEGYDFMFRYLKNKIGVFGRINVLETDRKFTPGDLKNLDILVSLMSEIEMKNSPYNPQANSILNQILGFPYVEEESLHALRMQGWDADDYYRICEITSTEKEFDGKAIHLNVQYIKNIFDLPMVYMYEHKIIILLNETRKTYKSFLDEVKCAHDFNRDKIFSCSLKFKGIRNLNSYYKQAIFARNDANRNQARDRYFSFYMHALNYIVDLENFDEKVLACQPDIVELWEKDKKGNGNLLEVFRVYLMHERSFVHASEKLHFHRNTLIYQINKICSQMNYDIKIPYNREYILTSIRILTLYDKKRRA